MRDLVVAAFNDDDEDEYMILYIEQATQITISYMYHNR